MSNSKIQIKSLFSGWISSDYERALDWATWAFRAMTMGDEDYRINHINTRLSGVQFNLKDLHEHSA